MNLIVKHKAPLRFMKSTSYVSDNNGLKTTVTFQPMERVESEFRRVWNTPGYQAHLTAKERRI